MKTEWRRMAVNVAPEKYKEIGSITDDMNSGYNTDAETIRMLLNLGLEKYNKIHGKEVAE